ncbi:MAG: 1-acyl-sn-glycerol-3-phosphate acyltransferase [Deltaproteobacteria bacterium]|nr:1-acyl-sn-glycerol-3-phosphate acyltransferase [Deltaproteobacteria bacterium]MBW2158489.1 1-acyl-sn-glycerol-3-phosphate acyltransferase [Deltaproteobacteria bacterium]
MTNMPELARRSPTPAPYTPNAILRWLYRRFFAHIRVDENWSRGVRDAASKGVVVYVMRSLSFLDFICLDFLLKKFGLPLVRFVNDLGLWILEPFGKGERRLSLRRQIPETEALEQTVGDGFSALLFLRRPPKLGSQTRRGRELEVDLIEALVARQRTSSQPILLVPQTFVWSKLAATASPSLLDLLFGPVQWPGRVRVLFQFLLNYRDAKLCSGEPFDVRAFLEKNPDLTDEQAADKVRYALLRRMERDRAVILGPMKKTTARIQDELLRSPRVRTQIEQYAGDKGISYAKAENVARKQLRRLCAKQSLLVVDLLHRFFTWVWSKMYDGVVLDKDGLERVREAARDASLVLLPSHKSHIDYLVLSDMLYGHAMMPPLIAAGDNLSFWPLGVLLRRGGAFFIRRSFHGDALYPVLVEAYVRKLLAEGFTIEFFLEGGRSRIGKPLPPKYGLLSMVFESASKLRSTKVKLVPISIGYERIIEERSFVHELSGGDKQSENVSDLIKSSSILRSKWGRLYVQFGDIIDFDEFKEETVQRSGGEISSLDDITPEQQRNAVRALAHKVMYSINEVTVVTPAALVATALLSHQKRGMTRASLLTACEDLLATLDVMQARIAQQLRIGEGRIREDTIDEALHLFLDARLIIAHDTGPDPIYTIHSERRIALEYYQNTIIHFFVPRAMISASVLVDNEQWVDVARLNDRVRQLSRLFKHEFMYRTDATFDEIFQDALRDMAKDGEIDLREGYAQATEGAMRHRIERYAMMLQTFFESYLLALRGAEIVLDGPIPRKDWYKRTLALGQQMYLAGEIERRESLSKLKLETALKALQDYRLVQLNEDILERGEDVESVADLHALEPKLTGFLR